MFKLSFRLADLSFCFGYEQNSTDYKTYRSPGQSPSSIGFQHASKSVNNFLGWLRRLRHCVQCVKSSNFVSRSKVNARRVGSFQSHNATQIVRASPAQPAQPDGKRQISFSKTDEMLYSCFEKQGKPRKLLMPHLKQGCSIQGDGAGEKCLK